jgi:beta-glucosidase-like glycosyl hydrolase
MQALREFGDMKSNVVRSLESGCDCIFICNDREIVECIVDEVTFKTSEELNYKLVKLSKNKIIDDFNENKKVLSTRENIKKILEKKQIEIKL